MVSERKVIKAIAFDIGGVLNKGRPQKHWQLLCNKLNIEPDKFHTIRRIDSNKIRQGRISLQKYIFHIAKKLKINPKKLYDVWKETKIKVMQKDKKIENLIKHLRENYKIATSTNINSLHHQIRIKKNIYDVSEVKVISCKDKVMKPNLNAYKLHFRKLKMNPSEIIFADDNKYHLIPAEKLGMKQFIFKTSNS